MGMAYDANGNRKSVVYTQADPGGTTTQQRVYQVQANSNRLLGYDQTQSTAGGSTATEPTEPA